MDEFEAWSVRKKKKPKKPLNLMPSSLAGGVDEIPQILGKKPLAAEDRPEEERMTREQAEALAGKIIGWLEPFTEYAEVAGSYRRGRQDPGDLDVVVILKPRIKLPEITELWISEGKASAVNWVGEKKTQMLIDGVKVDIRTTTPRALGAALLYFTGPAGYNIGIRRSAKSRGMKLNEYGIFNRETNEYLGGATEEEIYEILGKNFRPATERRAEENVSFATEENNEMQEAIIRGLRNLSRDGYVVAAPPYGNRSRNFYQYLSTEIMAELAELGSDDEGPEVTGSGRAIDPYNVVRSLARNQSFSMPDNDNNELSVGIADMVMSFTQQSTMMDEQDGFIAPEGYTRMVFDLPYDGRITRRLAFEIAFSMGIRSRASDKLILFSTPQKNRNCSMITNMLIEDLQPEVSGMTDSEKEQFYQEFGVEILRQLDYWNGPMYEEWNRNKEWVLDNYGPTTVIEKITVREDIKDRAVTAAQRLNPFSAEEEEEEIITRSLGEIPDDELRMLYQQGKISKMQMQIGIGLKMDSVEYEDSGDEPEYNWENDDFEASAIYRGKKPEGAVAKALLSKKLMDEAELSATLEKLENAVRMGMISEEEVMKKLTDKFGAESYKPPAAAVKAAKRGLEQRKKWGRGGLSPAEAKSQGIDSGVTRARKIASGKVSKHDVRRMSAFNRHRKNNNPGKKMPDGGPTAGTIAWNLWGGTSGVNWAKKKSAAMNAETQEFADNFEIQIRTSRGNTTERIPVGRSMLVRRLREILGRRRQPYAIDVFGTEAAFNVMGPYGMQVYRPKPKLLATYKYGQFESGEMADHLNEKLGL